MLNVTLIENPAGLRLLKPFWNELLSASDMDMPYMTYEWFRMYWDFFEKRGQMLVCLVTRNNTPVAIAPLMRIPALWRGVPHTALTFIANYFSCRTGLINPSGSPVIEPVLDRLRREHISYDIFYANFIPENSSTDQELKDTIASRQLNHRKLDWNRSPYILLPGSWDEYLRSREKHFRDNLKRTIRIFESSQDYRIRRYTETSRFEEAWGKLLEVSRNTWKYKEGTAIANKTNEKIFRTIAEMALAGGWFKMLLVEHKEKPIAFTYELAYKQTLFFNKTGFDEQYARLSPGTYILSRSIRDAIEGGYREFDLLGRNEEYKMRFTSALRTHHKYIIFWNTALGRLLAGYELGIIPGARKMVSTLKRRNETSAGNPEKTQAVSTQRTQSVSGGEKPLRGLRHAFKAFAMAVNGYPQR